MLITSSKICAVDRDELLRAKRKAGREKRSLDRRLIRDLHPRAVAERARAALGREEEIAQRLVDDAGDDLVACLASAIEIDQTGKCCR